MTAAILILLNQFAGTGDPAAIEAIRERASRPPENGGVHGAVLVRLDGEVGLREAFGQADREQSVANEPDTKFLIASLTKSFTAAIVLQLVEEGVLSLDGIITEYLPWYREDTGSRVTLHHLLAHTSGIPNYLANVQYFTKGSRAPYKPRVFVETYCSGDLEFAPGKQYAYSPSGYVILGEIISTVTGQSLNAAFQSRIASPLGLKSTGFAETLDVIKGLALGYNHTQKGFSPARPMEISTAGASGAMYSTIDDLLRWHDALTNGEILSDESRQRMFQPNLDQYGYGWFITTKTIAGADHTVHSHGGRINGFNTATVHVPSLKLSVIILTNVEQRSAMTTAMEIIDRVSR